MHSLHARTHAVAWNVHLMQVTIPATGARLFLASDGLWDATAAKALIGSLRGATHAEAAHKANRLAIQKKGLADDVTVIVVDFCPNEADRTPAVLTDPLLKKQVAGVQVLRPLDAPSSTWK